MAKHILVHDATYKYLENIEILAFQYACTLSSYYCFLLLHQYFISVNFLLANQ